jgi:signal peptidase II
VKFKHVVLVVFVILLADQLIKYYIKTHFYLGQELNIVGTWGKLSFIENEGMAFGWNFGGKWGKLGLTLFRLVAGMWGFYFINQLIKDKYKAGLIFCASLILAGALGNLIDSIFYGKIFTDSGYHSMKPAQLVAWGKGYGDLFYGRVVDMFYFPIIRTTWPKWVPMFGGQSFEFFRPIFNLADAAISTGVITILLFQKRLLKH